MTTTTIDTDTIVTLPWDWYTVEENRTYGTVPLKLKLYEPKGKTLKEVKEETKDMRVANWAVLQYLHEHPEHFPEEFKSYWCYFFGTLLRVGDGDWSVPCSSWDGSKFYRCADWLSGRWDSDDRVVLLDDSCDLDVAELTLESLNLRLEKVEKILAHYNLTEI